MSGGGRREVQRAGLPRPVCSLRRTALTCTLSAATTLSELLPPAASLPTPSPALPSTSSVPAVDPLGNSANRVLKVGPRTWQCEFLGVISLVLMVLDGMHAVGSSPCRFTDYEAPFFHYLVCHQAIVRKRLAAVQAGSSHE